MSLLTRTSLLRYLATQNPHLWEILHPHVPLVSEGARNVLAATIIRSVASGISNLAVAKDLQGVGKNLFDAGIKLMTYENTEFAFANEVMINPQPEPPGKPAFYGALLTILADSITSSELKITADSLRRIGSSLLKT